jgi:tetratricopeptide (TPR) repeat protein
MKGRTIPLILFSLSLLPFFPVCLVAQQYGSIGGELHAARTDFTGRVLIELRLHGSPITSEYTDEQGKFSFPLVTNNLYHIVVNDDRFYPVDQQVSVDLSVSALTMVEISLIPRAQPAPHESADRNKGSNPYIVDTQEYRRHFPKKVLKEFDKGVKEDRDGKRDDAIKHYEKVVSMAPDFYPARNNLGSDYLASSEFAQAQEQFEQAIKLNQSDAEAHLNLANVFLMTKDYDRALANVQEGLRRNPNSALGEFLLGSIYERLGKSPDAEQALHKALEIDPGMSRVRLELVNLYLSEQKAAEAREELKAFLKASPNDPLAPKVRQVLEKLQAAR